MGDLAWKRRDFFGFPLHALKLHAVAFGSSGSGKTETLLRIAYGARKDYGQQVIYLDAKGETKREDEVGQDNAARFVAAMHAAGANTIQVFPALHYNGWHGTPTELKNRLLSVIDFSESAYYGDVATNVLDLTLGAPTTPRSSGHFLANLGLDRLKAIYKNDPHQYRRVMALDKTLLQQVEMRYQVFFSAMAGQLDGTLDYTQADAVYLRVRGFALRNEAPRLGRFLVSDFMHYIAERRKAGVQTLLIIDEFNALRMREETTILFEQVRSFGSNLVISAQGYSGLGPHEYAERILDACSTYILHACSDPGEITQRAGKRLFFDTSYSQDAEGNEHQHIRPRYDWRVSDTAVMQQSAGQAYWIHRGRAQHVQTAQVPLTPLQVEGAWKDIKQQADLQEQLLTIEAQRRADQQAQRQVAASSTANTKQPSPSAPGAQTAPAGTSKKRSSQSATKQAKPQPSPATPVPPAAPHTYSQAGVCIVTPHSVSVPPLSPIATPPVPPTPDPDDDEPDRL